MNLGFLAAIVLVLLVAVWAMLMMLVSALKDREHLSLGFIFFGSFAMMSYNRKHFCLFAACVGVEIVIVAIMNVLFWKGLLVP